MRKIMMFSTNGKQKNCLKQVFTGTENGFELDRSFFTGGRLYSSNLDGNNKEKLADSLTSNIVVGEEGIYFYEYHDDGSKNYDLRRKYDFNTKTLQYVISLSFSEKE